MKICKILVTLSIVCIALTGKAQQTPPNAESLVQNALAKANAENKKVLVVFHASWCGWCKKMDASINDKDCAPLFKKSYVIAHITTMEDGIAKINENPGGDSLLKMYSNNIETGLPFWVVLNKNGDVMKTALMPKEMTADKKEDTNVGCPAQPNEVAYFGQVLKETSALTNDEIDIIKNRFARNKTK
jgi:thiol:disulfide interchange protein